MLILLDTANMKEIKELSDLYPVDGITTNPSIVVKEKRDFMELMKDILSVLGPEKMLHIQAVGLAAEEIVEEAVYLNENLKGNIYVKIPVTPQGIKAIRCLKQKSIKTTATAVCTPLQAVMAAKAGADFIIPYVNRIDNISGDGVEVVSDIINLFEIHDINARIIAASFKNVRQVLEIGLAGAQAVTVAPDIFRKMIEHPLVDSSVEQFIRDWKSLYKKERLI